MEDARIVRNRAKISAAVVNARATVALREQEGLEAFVLSFAPERPARAGDDRGDGDDVAESMALSKELKKRGFAFVGPTTMFALMEAIGVFDPHLVGCFATAGRVERLEPTESGRRRCSRSRPATARRCRRCRR